MDQRQNCATQCIVDRGCLQLSSPYKWDCAKACNRECLDQTMSSNNNSSATMVDNAIALLTNDPFFQTIETAQYNNSADNGYTSYDNGTTGATCSTGGCQMNTTNSFTSTSTSSGTNTSTQDQVVVPTTCVAGTSTECSEDNVKNWLNKEKELSDQIETLLCQVSAMQSSKEQFTRATANCMTKLADSNQSNGTNQFGSNGCGCVQKTQSCGFVPKQQSCGCVQKQQSCGYVPKQQTSCQCCSQKPKRKPPCKKRKPKPTCGTGESYYEDPGYLFPFPYDFY